MSCNRGVTLVDLPSVIANRRSGASLVFVCVLALAGCSSRQAVSTTTTVTTTSETTTTVAPLPALGETVGIFLEDRGFGEVKPSQFFNGGDTAGLVQHIRWKSWGGPEAVGTGLSEYVAPNQDVTEGRSQPATVVAFKLGTCFGNFITRPSSGISPSTLRGSTRVSTRTSAAAVSSPAPQRLRAVHPAISKPRTVPSSEGRPVNSR